MRLNQSATWGSLRNRPILRVVRILSYLLLMSSFSSFYVSGQETYRTAYDVGFEDGRQSGLADRDGQKAYDFANDVRYQNADHGFDLSIHERDVFVLAYRRGFEDGYEKGYGLGAEDPPVSDTSRAESLP